MQILQWLFCTCRAFRPSRDQSSRFRFYPLLAAVRLTLERGNYLTQSGQLTEFGRELFSRTVQVANFRVGHPLAYIKLTGALLRLRVQHSYNLTRRKRYASAYSSEDEALESLEEWLWRFCAN